MFDFIPKGISTDICRLCHGKFSPRSLLPAFNKWPRDFPDIVNDEAYAVDQSPPAFHVDFQQLVGVQLDPDPRLSEFVCKKCHREFYKCHNILVRFLQMVNHLPLGKDNSNRWDFVSIVFGVKIDCSYFDVYFNCHCKCIIIINAFFLRHNPMFSDSLINHGSTSKKNHHLYVLIVRTSKLL